EAFSVKRVQDELIGQMAELLGADYDTLTLEIGETESRQRALARDPSPNVPPAGSSPAPPTTRTPNRRAAPPEPTPAPEGASALSSKLPTTPEQRSPVQASDATTGSLRSVDDHDERLRGHVVSPVPTTDRLQSIQRLVADQLGDALPD